MEIVGKGKQKVVGGGGGVCVCDDAADEAGA
jgi:hypothetical protein